MRDLREVPSRLRDAQKHGHEVGVGHHRLALVPDERFHRGFEGAARRVHRGLGVKQRHQASARAHVTNAKLARAII